LALKAAPYAAIAILGALCWHFDARAVSNADLVRTQASQFKKAQADSDAAWSAKLNIEQETYTKQKEDIQNAYETSLDRFKSSADLYNSSHHVFGGVQPATAKGNSVPANAPIAEAGTAGFRQNLSADPFVAVRSSDVQTCSVITDYALKERDLLIANAGLVPSQ
jgi:hypothetical protein